MQAIRIAVVRSRCYRSSDGFHIYGDSGSGQMDWTHPMTPRRVPLWPDAPIMAGHLFSGHLMCPHLDSISVDGHLEGTHLLDQHGLPAAAMAYETDAYVFGRFGHAVVMEDAAGNAQTSGIAIYETVINSEPASAEDFQIASYEPGEDRLTFSFSPSERLCG